MTFDDVRAIALQWPEVIDGLSYGTPALEVRGKLHTTKGSYGDSRHQLGRRHDDARSAGRDATEYLLLY